MAQVPSVVAPAATLHASHASAQSVSQHTPSEQLPLTHWLEVVQVSPLALLSVQTPWEHHRSPVALQSPSSTQG